MQAFAEDELRLFLAKRMQTISEEVRAEKPQQLLNMNETQYIEYLRDKYFVEPIAFRWEERTVDYREQSIPASQFPSGHYVREGQSYTRQIIRNYLPYSGLGHLLTLRPSTFLMWSIKVEVHEDKVLYFDVINWRNDAEEIKREVGGILQNLRQQAEYSTADIEPFNADLERAIQEIVHNRKAQILKQMDIATSLGVPLRKSDQVPSTFAVPLKKHTPVIKPTAPATTFSPEPTLPEGDYNEILRIIHQMGVEMERHPEIYKDKGEEVLRDHFLMFLAPHYPGTTGETFNKSGKTDILIRYEGKNVFVAECKFWGGLKKYHETIDQLLSYLTWRDSKAAVVCFVRNSEIQSVLHQIEARTSEHLCFVKYRGQVDHGWFDFEFHLQGDDSRSVRLAVLCFHFPALK